MTPEQQRLYDAIQPLKGSTDHKDVRRRNALMKRLLDTDCLSDDDFIQPLENRAPITHPVIWAQDDEVTDD